MVPRRVLTSQHGLQLSRDGLGERCGVAVPADAVVDGAFVGHEVVHDSVVVGRDLHLNAVIPHPLQVLRADVRVWVADNALTSLGRDGSERSV